MKISTKGRYALRMLLDLAEHQDDGFIPLKTIAQRQGISKKYLEQIVGILNHSGILKTNCGYQGGYMLAVPPQQCRVGNILRITEGSLSSVACLETDENYCEMQEHCKTLPIWQGLNNVIAEYLDGITLQDILDDNSPTVSNLS